MSYFRLPGFLLGLIGLLTSLAGCDLTENAEKDIILDDSGIFAGALSENYALISTLSGQAELWQLAPQKLIHQWQHTDEQEGVIAVALTADEKYAVTAERNSIAWWSIVDGLLLSVWSLPDIYSVSLATDGQYALVGLADKAIYLNLRQGSTKYAFPHDDHVLATDLSDSGLYALTGSEDRTAKLWHLSDGKLVQQWPHNNRVSVVALSHNDKYAVTNAALSQINLWKTASGRLAGKLGPSRVTLASAAFSHHDRYLLTGQLSQRIDLWTLSSGQSEKFWRVKKTDIWRPNAASVTALNFIRDDKKFYSLATNGILQRWDLR